MVPDTLPHLFLSGVPEMMDTPPILNNYVFIFLPENYHFIDFDNNFKIKSG